MGNIEFDKRVRELMEGHQEMPDSNSWDFIARELDRRKRGRILFMRRSLTAAVAVAASLTLLLILDGPDDITAPQQKHQIAVSEIIEEPEEKTTEPQSEHTQIQKGIQPQSKVYDNKPAEKISVIEVPIIESPEKEVTPEQNAKSEVSVTLKEDVKGQEKISVQDTDKKSPETKRAGTQTVEEYLFKQRSNEERLKKGSKALIAMGTNISPSMASNSVTLRSVSQSGGLYDISNVVSTIQKADVPQDVISNTKFLMPVSIGVQVQFPVSRVLSVGTGLNYTLLFSNYDDISREETRQTHQTLHYIGIPVNMYINLFNNENLRLYLNSGFTVEKGLYAYYKIFENGVKRWSGNSIEGLQWSLNAGLGAEFYVNRNTGLYFDPSVAYFFDNNQPLSIRSAQPLQFKFELGFRFHL